MAMPSVVVEGLKNTSKGKLRYGSSYGLGSPPYSEGGEKLIVPLPLASPPKSISNRLSPLVALENYRIKAEAEQKSPEQRREIDSKKKCLNKISKSRRQEPLKQAFNSDVSALLVHHEKQAKKNIKAEGKQRKMEFLDGMQQIRRHTDYVVEELNTTSNKKYQKDVRVIDVKQEKSNNEELLIADLRDKHSQRAQLVSQNQKRVELLKKEISARKAALEELRQEKLNLCRHLEKSAVVARDLFNGIQNTIKTNLDAKTVNEKIKAIHSEGLQQYKQAIEVVNRALSNQDGLRDASDFTAGVIQALKKLQSNLEEEIERIEASKREEVEQKLAEQKAEEEKKKNEEEKLKAEKVAKQANAVNTVITSQAINVIQSAGSNSTKTDIPSSFVSPSALSVYEEVLKIQREVSALYADLVNTTASGEDANLVKQKKMYRFNLSKVINTPINAISDQSPSHLIDKIERLTKLLSGQSVEVGGKAISAKDHPSGLAFCKDTVAKKLVLQGARQISSSFNSAFSLAAVTLGIWVQLPDVGQLILAHMYTACPYLVPYYVPMKQNQPLEEYLKVLGYEVDGQSVESEDKYLKKLSGIVRLYAAVIQSPVPPHLGANPHPHGVHNGWTWLVRLLNLPPCKTITATVLFDFLEVAGHALFKTYGKQFQKLLKLLCEDVMPKIDAVTPTDEKGPVVRLKGFLEKCIKNGSIPVPDGYLSARWWKQRL
eukprot:gene19191-21113_t